MIDDDTFGPRRVTGEKNSSTFWFIEVSSGFDELAGIGIVKMMLRRLSAPMGFVGLAVAGSFSASRQTASCNTGKAPESAEKKSWPFDAKVSRMIF